MENNQLKSLFAHLINENQLLQVVISSPRDKTAAHKIVIRPLLIKNQKAYQFTIYIQQKVVHENYAPKECLERLLNLFDSYKQGLFCTEKEDFHLLINNKHEPSIQSKPPTVKALPMLEHNRKKNYLLPEGTPIPFLVELDVMSAVGKVHPQKMNKFKQINRFLEMINDMLVNFSKETRLHIVDFGCGKAYLTFALYHFLKIEKDFDISVTGLDLKADVVAYCQKVADKLSYTNLKFQKGDINTFDTHNPVDLMVCLHACDTATDAALEKAVHWQTKVIMAVPCCQHELYNQVRCKALTPLLSHGILKERFAALATDAARAQLLEIKGYKTQIMEFIDLEHTPKNLLIRAVLQKNSSVDPKKIEDYQAFKQMLNILPNLETRLIS